ncbi:MAG: class I SAM-dependent RNA methyltransferase, partial [Clostridia bacterium]|nr:class I SAM-dependent RNA methyltransferase [Clostridia bacterium]
MEMQLIATATFGLEAVVKREIEALGYEIVSSEDGRITFKGDERALVKANLWLRTADRVYVKLAEFKAVTFQQLIDESEKIDWAKWLPEDGKFIVTGTSVKSSLHSVPACQSTIKKSVISALSAKYGRTHFDEDGVEYGIRFSALKDRFIIMLDSSGEGLHKRGYRVKDVSAPIKETLASALVQLSFFKAGRLMADPLCGSGTIAIEAAMLARNIAPGLSRSFAAQNWDFIPSELWKEEKKAAFSVIDYDADVRILASDIDKRAVAAARVALV